MNNTLEFAIDLSRFHDRFQGWWLTIHYGEASGCASCAPYGKGQPYGMQHHADSDDPMDTGFHATADTPHAALRDVMRQAQEYLEAQDG